MLTFTVNCAAALATYKVARAALVIKKESIYIKRTFSVATHICRLFYHKKTTSPNLEIIIANNLIPVRPARHHERRLSVKGFRGFLYRVA